MQIIVVDDGSVRAPTAASLQRYVSAGRGPARHVGSKWRPGERTTLYLALLVISVVGSFSLVPPGALEGQIKSSSAGALPAPRMAGHIAGDARRSVGLAGGSDLAVREAAYGYRHSQEASDDGTVGRER